MSRRLLKIAAFIAAVTAFMLWLRKDPKAQQQQVQNPTLTEVYVEDIGEFHGNNTIVQLHTGGELCVEEIMELAEVLAIKLFLHFGSRTPLIRADLRDAALEVRLLHSGALYYITLAYPDILSAEVEVIVCEL